MEPACQTDEGFLGGLTQDLPCAIRERLQPALLAFEGVPDCCCQLTVVSCRDSDIDTAVGLYICLTWEEAAGVCPWLLEGGKISTGKNLLPSAGYPLCGQAYQDKGKDDSFLLLLSCNSSVCQGDILTDCFAINLDFVVPLSRADVGRNNLYGWLESFAGETEDDED